MKLKSKKSALILSCASLIVCFAMLVGSTFAWFTDTATASVNTIQSGKLDVDIVGEDTPDHLDTLDFKKAAGAPGNEAILWEPGCTYLTQGFRIANNGNLALKWKVTVNKGTTNTNEKNADLLDVIDFYVLKGDQEIAIADFTGELKASESKTYSEVYYIKATMKTSAGNDYQGLMLDGITVTVYATQLNSEYDSFSPDYDKDAEYITYPAGVTEDTFDNAENVTYTDNQGNVQTGTKPAVAAYTDAEGNVAYAADIKAAVMSGATEIYCKKNADMQINATSTNRTEALTDDLTIHANGANFNYGEIALNSSTAGANTDTGNVTIKVYDAKNIKIWGNTPAAGVTWNIELVNCHNEGADRTGTAGELIMLWGATGTVNATVKNCSVKDADLGIYFGCDGSLSVENSSFTGCATGIKISYKGTGTRTDRIENCVFTNCGCTSEMAGTGSTAYLADDSAAIKYKTSGGNVTLTLKGNTISETIGDKGDMQIASNVTVTNE